LTEYNCVLIIGESTEEHLGNISLELLSCGRRLADQMGEGVSVLLMGSQVKQFATDLIHRGADRIYIVEDPLLEDYQSDLYVSVVEKIVKQSAPKIILIGQTPAGRDIAPRVGFKLKSAISMDCVEMDIDRDTGVFVPVRSVYGGAARAKYSSVGFPQVVTLRPKTVDPLEPDRLRKGEIIEVPADLKPEMMKTRMVKKVKEEISGPKLEEAAVVVAGGRGIGSKEGFEPLEELAILLNGAVGGTRPAVDNGWLPVTRQIGLTGKVVAPDLYFAIGLSGSSQHLSGCSGARNIIAINRDPEANILKEASFGVIGDWKEIMPSFLEKLRELLKD